MKRNEIVKKLISEGFSINTLATMSDKQIVMLGERILSEQSQPAGTLTVPKNTDVEKIKTLTSQGLNVKQDVKEEKPLPKKKLKKKKTETSELKEWVEDLVNQNYHPFTSKGEIMGMIQTKLDEQETMTPMPTSKPTKGHNGIPEWLSYDAIKGDGGSTVTAPVKTPAKTKPGEKPKTRNPYQPGPGINPNPKAKL